MTTATPTKTLRFDQDVLQVLSQMIWKNDGQLGVITTDLTRDLYVKVNKALEAMGGRWDRKVKGHVFQSDPRSQVEGLVGTGSITIEKEGFFETPREIVEMMLDLLPLDMDKYASTLEPEAGMGAIACVLKEHKAPGLVLVEKNEKRVEELLKNFDRVIKGDFLQFQAVGYWTFNRVYMNPPFENQQDIDHVRHAYELLSPGGGLAAIMSEGPFYRQDRKAQDFRDWLASVNGTSQKLPDGSFKASGTMVNTRMVIIHK